MKKKKKVVVDKKLTKKSMGYFPPRVRVTTDVYFMYDNHIHLGLVSGKLAIIFDTASPKRRAEGCSDRRLAFAFDDKAELEKLSNALVEWLAKK